MKLRNSDTEAATLTNDELARCGDQSDPAVVREWSVRPKETKRRGTRVVGRSFLHPNTTKYQEQHWIEFVRANSHRMPNPPRIR